MNPWYILGCELELLALGAVGIGTALGLAVLLCRWLAHGLEDDLFRTKLEREHLQYKYLRERYDAIQERLAALDTLPPME